MIRSLTLVLFLAALIPLSQADRRKEKMEAVKCPWST